MAMAGEREQIEALRVRVSKLETWAGPGQAEAMSTGMRALRTDVAAIRRVQTQHTTAIAALQRDVTGLKTDMIGVKAELAVLKDDVAVLKQDMGDVKVALAEILRRLPAA